MVVQSFVAVGMRSWNIWHHWAMHVLEKGPPGNAQSDSFLCIFIWSYWLCTLICSYVYIYMYIYIYVYVFIDLYYLYIIIDASRFSQLGMHLCFSDSEFPCDTPAWSGQSSPIACLGDKTIKTPPLFCWIFIQEGMAKLNHWMARL